MADLIYFDRAYLYNKCSDNSVFVRWFGKILNSKARSGGILIPDELLKEKEEVILIEWAKSEAKRYMRLYNRSKIIDIPMPMIYIVPNKAKYDSLFVKGLIGERSSNECFFTAKIFQAIFFRMSFCQVATDEDKNLFYVDGGTEILKRGVASLLSRKFIEESIVKGILEAEDFSESFFDIEAEQNFKLFLEEFCRCEENLSPDDRYDVFIEAVINEKSFSQIIKERKFNSLGSEFLAKTSQKILVG